MSCVQFRVDFSQPTKVITYIGGNKIIINFYLLFCGCLQETIFKDIILPILKIVSSVHISFPTCNRARSVICYKIIDALYVISLRIGFEMTRDHMTFVLQKFFAAFNRVYEHTDEETTDLPCEATVGSPNEGQQVTHYLHHGVLEKEKKLLNNILLQEYKKKFNN